MVLMQAIESGGDVEELPPKLGDRLRAGSERRNLPLMCLKLLSATIHIGEENI